MIIRTEQLEALSHSAFSGKLQQWAAEFCAEFPAQTENLSSVQVSERLRLGSGAAREYGLTTDAEIREYLSILMKTGADAEGKPAQGWLRDIFQDSTSTSAAKLDRVAALLPDPETDREDRMALAQVSEDSDRSSASRSDDPEDSPYG